MNVAAAAKPLAAQPLDAESVRRDFPILARSINGKPLVYLDSGASAQQPLPVMRAVERYETHSHANVHRGVHTLSQEATDAFEGARDRVRRFINAASVREVVFVRGTTEAINLVAQAYVRPRFGRGDEILISALEHHANIVPWQLVCEQTGCTLKVAPIDRKGEVIFDAFVELLSARTRIVAIAHVSNALGTVLPVKRMIAAAHEHGARVLVDGAQAVPHARVDVRALDADFYAFSSHKLYGPTGIGILYAREALLESMPPWQGGGDMIRSVTFAKSTYNDLPWKFEAGTPHISGAVGLAAAIDYVEALGLDAIAAHEQRLLQLATAELAAIRGVQIIGTAAHKSAIISFTMAGVHPHDIGTILDHEGIAIRTGHHCAMPVMDFFGVPATARASFGCYSTAEDVARLVAAVERVREVFA
ncbi:MAG TPA: cysteine desulfurase [Steroidobacteraceae bacterium]|jgi:cysteine desulfurase/selenocysteine lyase|nr:cysteine desulfurase [Steroidobacteraceae bacterium]